MESLAAGFAGANLYYVQNLIYEYLAVADMTRIKSLYGGVYYLLYRHCADYYLNLNLGQEIHLDRNAAVELGLALLYAVAENLSYGHAGNSDLVESRLELVKLVLSAYNVYLRYLL